MKSGELTAAQVFRSRRLLPSLFWTLFLAVGSLICSLVGSFPFFTGVLVASFAGLSEAGCWRYKTNLSICAAAVVLVALAGVFTWGEGLSVFVLFFAINGYLVYTKNRMRRILPSFGALASRLSQAAGYNSMIDLAWKTLQEMAPENAVFIILASPEGALYLPAHYGKKSKGLKRNGGTPWKVYASGEPIIVSRVTAHDQPLDRDAASIVSVPLIAHGERLGVLQLEAATPRAFTEDDVINLSLAAVIIANELYLFETE